MAGGTASTEPRAEARGETADRARCPHLRAASTEPRAEARGEMPFWREPTAEALTASTEPRAEARGETAQPRLNAGRPWLQRSRVPKHAESQWDVDGKLLRTKLQRSRVPKHAERYEAARDRTVSQKLQRSRVPKHAESRLQCRPRDHRSAASTEPRAEARGENDVMLLRIEGRKLQRSRVPKHAESYRHQGRRSAVHRFNGAACRSTRRGG